MSKDTNIEWCDSTVNPTMGCDGCELWSKTNRSCYAGILHQRYGGSNKGFSPRFEILTMHPGRMAKAAAWSDLTGTDRPHKPWLNGLPRHIFISDMSDAMSKDVTFDYLKEEVIDNVTSEKGRRHVWMWLTKRPSRMADFAQYLHAREIEWPTNLMAGTSITDQATADSRTPQLLRVPGRLFLSAEPLYGPIDYLASWLVGCSDRHLRPRREDERLAPRARSLRSFALVIVGGESGDRAQPFNVNWARDIQLQCKAACVRCFIKQLGTKPRGDGMCRDCADHDGTCPNSGLPCAGFKDSKGGDPSEWPKDLRVRQMPEVTRG